MTESNRRPTGKRNAIIFAVLLVVVGAIAAATAPRWLPAAREFLARAQGESDAHDEHDHDAHGHDDHAGHDHGDEGAIGHDESESIELNELALRNIGLTTGVAEPTTYVKTVSVPAIVVERPGRSQVDITAPLTGVVTRVYPIEGQVTKPGAPLFDLRLTHEDVVSALSEFLRMSEELEVVQREIQRLQSAGEGVVAGRRVVEQRYEEQKIKAALHAQTQGLLLHGLTQDQIDEILRTRTLLQNLTVRVPAFPTNGRRDDIEHLYHVQKVLVKPGQHVIVGESLAVLADHCLLYVEGQAFGDDAERLAEVAEEGKPLRVIVSSGSSAAKRELDLKIVYVADQIDADSRALRFYLELPNKQTAVEERGDARFVSWKYRPGQRMEVRIPIGKPWENQIVLPPDAVVEDGAQAFVFSKHGSHFDRTPVHVIYRGKDAVVVENAGDLAGSTLAMSGAHMMQLELENKSGGAIDPHAGHNH